MSKLIDQAGTSLCACRVPTGNTWRVCAVTARLISSLHTKGTNVPHVRVHAFVVLLPRGRVFLSQKQTIHYKYDHYD